MTETRIFDAVALAGVTTGMLLEQGGFSKIHEAIEHIIGHPVWTHEMAESALWEKARAAVLAVHPQMPVAPVDDYLALAADMKRLYPDGLAIPRGKSKRTQDQITTLIEQVR